MPQTPETDGVADALAETTPAAGPAHADAVPAHHVPAHHGPGDPTPAVTDPDAVEGGLAMRLRPPGGWSDDTGDVPGWVLVTLMTAALVVGLWAIAGPALTEVFQSAIERVTSSVG